MSLLSETAVTVLSASTLVQTLPLSAPLESVHVATALYSVKKDGGSVGVHEVRLSRPIPQSAIMFNIGAQRVQDLEPNTVALNVGLNTDSDVYQNFVVPPVSLSALTITANENLTTLKVEVLNTPLQSGQVLFKIMFV